MLKILKQICFIVLLLSAPAAFAQSQVNYYSQIQKKPMLYGLGGGSANVQTVTTTPSTSYVQSAYTTGLEVCWLPSNANTTTTPTVNLNGLGAKTIVKTGGAALVASDLTTTAVACAIYDGTHFDLQNPQTGGGGGGTPASPTSSLQYNNSGAFGGSTIIFTPNSSSSCAINPSLTSCDNYQFSSTSHSACMEAILSSDASTPFVTNEAGFCAGLTAGGGSFVIGDSETGTASVTASGGLFEASSIGANSTTAYGVYSTVTDDPNDTNTGQSYAAGYFATSLTRASGSIAKMAGIIVPSPVNANGGGSPAAETPTNMFGVEIQDMLDKGTNTAALQIDSQTTGGLAINVAGGKTVLPASTTTQAPLNLPQGTAPTSPANGDFWTTSSGVFARIAGSTQSLLSGTINPGTSGDVAVYTAPNAISSSEPLAGAGPGIVTGPTSSTNGDIVVYSTTTGQTADSGILASSVVGSNANCAAAGLAYFATSGQIISCDTNATDNGSGALTAVSFATSGSNGGITGPEGTCASLTAASATDLLCPNSTAHEWEKSVNNGSYLVVPGISTTAGTSGDVVTLTANGYDIQDSAILGTNLVTAASNGTTKQLCTVASSNKACTFIDFPDVHIIPAANCNNATAGAGWSIGSGGTVTCRAGTYNLGGYVAITDTSGTFAQFAIAIPDDWDTSTDPYIRFQLAYPGTDGGSSHTIIPNFAVSCIKGDGTTSDDVAFATAHSAGTITLSSATANLAFTTSTIQMNSTDMSGCVAGSWMVVKVGRATDTATSAVNFYSATITFPRLLVVQAN